MVAELLHKYIWLVQTFIRAGEKGLSLDEISYRWESRFGTEYSRRTFNNHRDAVEGVFGIRIECNRSSNRYFIRYSDDVSDENAENAWLINTFTVNNMLNMSKERLSGRVSVEDIPSGRQHLTAIMEAMTESHEIKIIYHKYTRSHADSYTLRPYAVKESAKRWYVIGYCVEKESVRVYGLDRVKSLTITDQTFNMPDGYDVDEEFATSYGIYLTDDPPVLIRFRTSEVEARYIRDLPLHQSQEEVSKEDGKVTFSIFVRPNSSLIMEFCKYGSRIEILSPQKIRDAVTEHHMNALKLYK